MHTYMQTKISIHKKINLKKLKKKIDIGDRHTASKFSDRECIPERE